MRTVTRVLVCCTALVATGLWSGAARATPEVTDLGTFEAGEVIGVPSDWCPQETVTFGGPLVFGVDYFDSEFIKEIATSFDGDPLLIEVGPLINGTWFFKANCLDGNGDQLVGARLYSWTVAVCDSIATLPPTSPPETKPPAQTEGQATTTSADTPTTVLVCPQEVGSGGGSLPGTGNTSDSLVLVAALAVLSGTAIMLLRRPVA